MRAKCGQRARGRKGTPPVSLQKPTEDPCPEIEIHILTQADTHSRRRNREAEEEKGAKNSAANRPCQSGQGPSWVA